MDIALTIAAAVLEIGLELEVWRVTREVKAETGDCKYKGRPVVVVKKVGWEPDGVLPRGDMHG